jgi:multidrug efflux system membrane fusion protein
VWLIVLVLVVLIVLWFLVPHGGQGQAGAGRHGRFPGANVATTVASATVTRGDMPIYLNELGSATPLATVLVQPQIAGYIQTIAFKEGEMVKKGQLLVQIDDRLYRAQLQSAEAALARDQAALNEAQVDLKRYQLLLSQDSIASQQVDLQAATVKQDEGTVKADEATIATAKLNIAYCHVVSPVTGRVGLRQVDVGNYVSSSLTNGLVIVTEITPMDVEFALPEDNLPQVQARLHSGASLPVVAYDRTGVTQLAVGKILTLDNIVDSTTGTVKAKARFDNGAGTLFPQQFVNVRVLVDTLHNAVIAPTAAVLRGANGLYAYVVQGGQNHHTVTMRTITAGPAAGEATAIISGLSPGDIVVTDGSDRLREGAAVILPGDCIPAFPGAGAGHGAHRPGAHGPYSGAAAGAGHSGGCPTGERQAGQPSAASITAASGSVSSGGPGSADDSSGGSAPAPSGSNQGVPGQGTAASSMGGAATGPGRVQAMLAPLNLDAQQQLKAQAIFTKARGDAMTAAAGAGDDPDAQRNARRQAMEQAFSQLEPLLRPDQKAKLAQVRAEMAQHRGSGGEGAGNQGGGDGGQR